MVSLLVRIPRFLCTRISIDKVAEFVSALEDINPKNSSKPLWAPSSDRNGTGFTPNATHSAHFHRKSRLALPISLTTTLPRPIESLSETFSAFSELSSSAAMPGGSESVLTSHSSRKAAHKNFLQIAGIGEGEACKRRGFFAGRGCALGCTCPWYQYCDESAGGTTEVIHVGICATSWKLLIVLSISLLCCSCTCVLLASNSQGQSWEEVSDEPVTPQNSSLKGWLGGSSKRSRSRLRRSIIQTPDGVASEPLFARMRRGVNSGNFTGSFSPSTFGTSSTQLGGMGGSMTM